MVFVEGVFFSELVQFSFWWVLQGSKHTTTGVGWLYKEARTTKQQPLGLKDK